MIVRVHHPAYAAGRVDRSRARSPDRRARGAAVRDADEHADAITAAILRSDRTSPEPHDDRFTAYRDVEVGKTRTRLLASSLRATGPIPKSRTSSVRFWINERQKSRLPSVGRYALLLSARSRATTLAWPPRA